jgi:hypothetical protein
MTCVGTATACTACTGLARVGIPNCNCADGYLDLGDVNCA